MGLERLSLAGGLGSAFFEQFVYEVAARAVSKHSPASHHYVAGLFEAQLVVDNRENELRALFEFEFFADSCRQPTSRPRSPIRTT